jgi:hypothetical protein
MDRAPRTERPVLADASSVRCTLITAEEDVPRLGPSRSVEGHKCPRATTNSSGLLLEEAWRLDSVLIFVLRQCEPRLSPSAMSQEDFN